MRPKFEIVHESKISKARVGKIHTAHGVIDTPNFVPVGTNAAVKALDSVQSASIGMQLIFCNTYHLIIQPGADIIEKAGGLHQFMNRSMPIITDSGGFQVFSLAYGSVAEELKSQGKKKLTATVLKILEEGVKFRSYRDGKMIFLTPESSVQAQKQLNSDIIIPLDELPPFHFAKDKLKKSLERTHRWEERSLKEHLKNPKEQIMYAVVHGGIDKELRKESANFLTKLPFDGFAIGGSVGKTKEQMLDMLFFTLGNLPRNHPNHLLGIGDLSSLEKAIPLGIDTFDSSYPTKAARHGLFLTKNGPIKILRSENRDKFIPIEEDCACFTCRHYTRGYLHHLFKANELSQYTLATIHNLHFMVQYMQNIREKILNDQL